MFVCGGFDELLDRLLRRHDVAAEVAELGGQALLRGAARKKKRAPAAGRRRRRLRRRRRGCRRRRARRRTVARAVAPPPGAVGTVPPLCWTALRKQAWIFARSAGVGWKRTRPVTVSRSPPVLILATIFGTVPSWWTAVSTSPLETDGDAVAASRSASSGSAGT